MSLFSELANFCVRDFSNEEQHKKKEKTVSMGPWGSEEGQDWSFNEDGDAIIKKVVVYGGEVIDSLTFHYELDDEDDYAKFGGDDGSLQGEFILNLPTEYLTGVSGTYRQWRSNSTAISSLKFISNLKEYGPYGKVEGSHFELPLEGGKILGFHGKMENYIYAIGVHMKSA